MDKRERRIVSVISFTEQGRELSEKVKRVMTEYETELFYKAAQGVEAWAKEQFDRKAALFFIGACGIAVRAIAPCVRDKLSDSPVLVLDEKGRYVIPILSGHVGGANELAERIAERIGAEAVITTATDINDKFAVDLFAKRNGLCILNREGIARVSAKVLRGERIIVSVEGYTMEGHIAGNCMAESYAAKGDAMESCRGEAEQNNSHIPEEIELSEYPPRQKPDVLVALKAAEWETEDREVLRLKPRAYVIGIGCKKGKTAREISEFIRKTIAGIGLDDSDIAMLASIDRKRKEEGICAWALEKGVPFVTFSEQELRQVEGEFQGSAFVEQTVGVDNVCERAALAACQGEGKLVLGKHAENGITVAVARRKWRITWER